MGISEYQLTAAIPGNLKNGLPVVRKIEKQLRNNKMTNCASTLAQLPQDASICKSTAFKCYLTANGFFP
jgi:hypothetical protein